MSHANALAQGYWDTLKASGYPMPACIQWSDEPSGDFGIAHTSYVNDCAYISFDDAYLPSTHTIYHEIGHAVQFSSPGLLEAFWNTVSFPKTIDEANSIATVLQSQGQTFQSWRSWAVETFADFFAWSVLDDNIQAQNWGVPLTDSLRTAVTNLFVNWSNESMALSPADLQSIATMIDARVTAAENNIGQRVGNVEVNVLREVLTKLDSGFNTTIPVLLDRLAAGDKHVETEVID